MKKLLFLLSSFSALALTSFVKPNELPIGAALPKTNVLLKDVSGKEVSLKDAKKQNGLLVMFSCNTCPYVIKNQPRTKEIAAFAAKHKFSSKIVYLNETNADLFCPKVDEKWSGAIPASLLINNKTGYKKFFEEQIAENKLEEEIKALINK